MEKLDYSDERVAILTATRDRVDGLQKTLQSITDDLSKNDRLSLCSIVIDDSTEESARAKNRETVSHFAPLFPRGVYYFGKEDYLSFLSSLSLDQREVVQATCKPLGASYYDSVGPRNLALLLSYSEDIVLIVDDDIVFYDSKPLANTSSIQRMIRAVMTGENDIIGAHLDGIPDQSTLEHLDDLIHAQLHPNVGTLPSYANPFARVTPREQGWRRRLPAYIASGGVMAFRTTLHEAHFPKIYNDDWHWISYHHRTNKKKVTIDNQATVIHLPSEWRFPTEETLRREFVGEVIFEAMHQYSEKSGLNCWDFPANVDWGSVARQYYQFLCKIMEEVRTLGTTRSLPNSPFTRYSQILPHLEAVARDDMLQDRTLYLNLVQAYIDEVSQWKKMITNLKATFPSWLRVKAG
ncbi:hypothetical protein HY605_00100 [Candidatus Peregrinibacteria bacterium]|nr:hypothetical protein [Candidatus Peregrinibacteria bacterium]